MLLAGDPRALLPVRAIQRGVPWLRAASLAPVPPVLAAGPRGRPEGELPAAAPRAGRDGPALRSGAGSAAPRQGVAVSQPGGPAGSGRRAEAAGLDRERVVNRSRGRAPPPAPRAPTTP